LQDVEHRLSNGLRIILEETPSSQVTCMSLFIRAGSIQETEADEGISRFMEKSLFRVTRNHGDIRTEISSYGGEFVSGVNQDFIYLAVTVGSAFSIYPVDLRRRHPEFRIQRFAGGRRRSELLSRMAEEQKNRAFKYNPRLSDRLHRSSPERQPYGPSNVRILAGDIRLLQ
jgi:hypothetical protein